jgi:hypothetical protein
LQCLGLVIERLLFQLCIDPRIDPRSHLSRLAGSAEPVAPAAPTAAGAAAHESTSRAEAPRPASGGDGCKPGHPVPCAVSGCAPAH